jgi:hypothetical protein
MSTTAQSLGSIFDEDKLPDAPAPAEQQIGEPMEETGEKDPAAAPPAEADPSKEEPKESRTVPVKALEDERRKRQDIERQFADLQRVLTAQQKTPKGPEQPQQAPDWFTDPEGAARHLQSQFEQQRLWDRGVMSETLAKEKYGNEIVDEAVQAALAAGIARHFYVGSSHPYADVVAWYKKQKVLSEIGDDPDAYRQKLREEVLAELGQQVPSQPQVSAQKSKAPVPKSLAGVPSAQPRDERGRFANPPSLSEILD